MDLENAAASAAPQSGAAVDAVAEPAPRPRRRRKAKREWRPPPRLSLTSKPHRRLNPKESRR